MRSTDRAKILGYCKLRLDAKYLLGCAVFIDILTPCAVFSKVLQSNDLDILTALTSLLQTMKEIEKLSSLPLVEWPMYSSTLKKLQDDNNKKVYQCQALNRFEEAEQYYANKCEKFCCDVRDCLCSRMEWTDQEIMRDIISVLATDGWEKIVEEHDHSSVLTG